MKRLLLTLIAISAVSAAHAAPAVVAAQMDDNYSDGLTWTAIPAMDEADSLAGKIGVATFPGGNTDAFWAGAPSDMTWAPGMQFSKPGSDFDSGWGAATGFDKITDGGLHGEWACQWAAAPLDVANDSAVGGTHPGASFTYDLQAGGTDTCDLLDTTIFGFGGFSSSLYMMSVDLYVTSDSPVPDYQGNWTLVLAEAIPNAPPFSDRFADHSLDPGDSITSVVMAGVPGSALLGMEIADSANPGATPIATGITGIRYDFFGWSKDSQRDIYIARTTAGCRVNTFLTEINANYVVSGSIAETAAQSWNLYE